MEETEQDIHAENKVKTKQKEKKAESNETQQKG